MAYGHAATVAVGAPQHVGYAAGPVQTHIQEHIVPAGPAIAQHHVQHGVVGSRTVQVGTQQVQVGHQYNVAGQTVHPRPAYSYVAKPAQNSQSTVALPEPVLPYAAAPGLAIPAAPTNQGPAPADTVTVRKIVAPGRVHTQITPQITRITPELQVNQVPYDVQVNVPVPVEREVTINKVVEKPYTVEHEVPVAVPEYYPVHQVRQNVVRPVVHEHTVSHSHSGYALAAAPAVQAVVPHQY